MKKAVLLLYVIAGLLFACGGKGEENNPEDVAKLLVIHDFSAKGRILDEHTSVRSEPDDTLDNIVGELPRGADVTITQRKGKQSVVDGTVIFWYNVTSGDVTGWVFGHSVAVAKK